MTSLLLALHPGLVVLVTGDYNHAAPYIALERARFASLRVGENVCLENKEQGCLNAKQWCQQSKVAPVNHFSNLEDFLFDVLVDFYFLNYIMEAVFCCIFPTL